MEKDYAQRIRVPFLSTVATCWPSFPPLPHAIPTTPAECTCSSFFSSFPSPVFHINTVPGELDPAATYLPVVEKSETNQNTVKSLA